MDTRTPKGRGSLRTTCATCGWPLKRNPSQLRERNFCDYVCRNTHPTWAKQRKPRWDTGMLRAHWITKPCAYCGKPVSRPPSESRERHFCDRRCVALQTGIEGRSGRPRQARVSGKTTQSITGYVYTYMGLDHPMASKNGFVAQHRLVMAERLGRPLRPEENVHHKNGDRADNRIENLELWVKTQPCGQRPLDLLAWARHIIDSYGPEEERLRALDN